MEISFDPAKRDATLRERGLDFADAPKLFADDQSYTAPDTRFDYGEDRFVTYGYVEDQAIVVVWMEREGARRIISMRRAHAQEMRNVGLGRS